MNKSELKSCFVISPIGDKASSIRKRSDAILKHVIRPICDEIGYKPERADEIDEPGLITKRIIDKIINSDLVIADLTGHNPNVFYELAIRHVTGKPLVQIIESDEKIPFDVFDFRTIQIDHKDMDSVEECKDKLRKYIAYCSDKKIIENPIIDSIKTLNIKLPFIKPDGIEIDLKSQTEQLLDELKNLRFEKDILLNKLFSEFADSFKSSESENTSSVLNLSGVWNSNLGLVRLVQKGEDVFGEYQYENEEWVGSIIGKIIHPTLIFHWEWKAKDLNGVGYLDIHESYLNGGWAYSSEFITYEFLLENPMQKNHLVLDQDWELWKDPTVE